MAEDDELDRETEPTACAGAFDLFAGKKVNGAVRLLAPLGEGGMGCVWIAEHLGLCTNVAVKFMTRALAFEPENVERFAREAAAAARVKSPHVVQMLDHGVTEEGVPYIVMELLEGRDLARILAEQGRLPPRLVVEIITQCARALSRAHRRGIVHRDIKPENIFLCDLGDATENGAPFVKILDFGIAKTTMEQVGSPTRTGVLLGSPKTMSPEQILGARDVDERTDLWSLGVVAYHALTGVSPFDGKTLGEIALRVQRPATPPSQRVGSLPREVDDWFARACAHDRADRFNSATEMADALAWAIGEERPQSTRRSPPTADAFPLVVAMAREETLPSERALTPPPPSPPLREDWIDLRKKRRPRTRDDGRDLTRDAEEHTSYADLPAGIPRGGGASAAIAALVLIVLAGGVAWIASRGISRSAPTHAAPVAIVAASTAAPTIAIPNAEPSTSSTSAASATSIEPTLAATPIPSAAPRPPKLQPTKHVHAWKSATKPAPAANTTTADAVSTPTALPSSVALTPDEYESVETPATSATPPTAETVPLTATPPPSSEPPPKDEGNPYE